jgi:TonB-linked SusC/RagA family outer membrane protein
MYKKIYCWLMASTCIAWQAFSQDIVIGGRVLLQPGNQPAVGATVQSVPGQQSVLTDSQGAFKLFLRDTKPDRLIVSYTGYMECTQLLDGHTNLQGLLINLQPRPAELDTAEVVSTGIQTLPRSRSTGAFEKLNRHDLQLQVGTNILDRLNGMVAGVQFDNVPGRPPITVRGLSTINGPQSPLIILDNFPYEGDIGNINPNDIENITVLKDAAAASIWGARAGNGVIVINTRKAAKGDPLRWQFNSTFQTARKPDLMYNPETLEPADQVALERDLFKKGYYSAAEANRSRPALPPVVEWLIAARDGRLSQAEADARIAGLAGTDLRRQAEDYLYEYPVYQQYNLQVAGGSEKYAFNLSGGYDKKQDNLGAVSGRYTLRSYSKIMLFKQLSFDANLQYTRSDNTNGRPAIADLRNGQYTSVYNPLVNPNGDENDWSPTYRKPFTDTAGGGRLLPWNYYPLQDNKYDQRKTVTDHVLLSLGLQANLLKGLQWQLLGRLESAVSNTQQLQGEESYATRNYINLFTQVDATGKYSFAVPRGSIIRNTNNRMQALDLRTQFNYQQAWGEHQLDALAGAEIRHTENSGYSSMAYGFDKDLLTSQKVDLVNPYKNFVTGASSYIADNTGFSGTVLHYVSGFANVGYSFRRRYTVTGSMRKDASNLLGVATNEKGVPLWSAGIAWDVKQERWMQQSWFNRLKLRLTTGYAGNIDPTRSAVTVLRTYPASSIYNQPYARVDQYGNPDLRWEKVQTNNLGIDFEIAGQRIGGSLDFYLKKARDLFGPKIIDPTVGIASSSVQANVAGMKGCGFELTLHTRNTKGPLVWQTTWLLSMSENRITDYISTVNTGKTLVNDGRLISQQVGGPVYSVVSYRWAGLDPANGDPQGYVNKAVSKDYAAMLGAGVTLADMDQHGSGTPVWYGAFRNDLNWKGLSLTINISWNAGYYFRRSSMVLSGLYAGAGHRDYYARWQQPGDEAITHVPSLVYPANNNRDEFYRNSSVTVSRADHIRLQFIQAAWQFKFGKKMATSQRIFMNLSNVGLLWKANKEGLDPDHPTMKPPMALAIGLNLSW